MPAAYIDLPMYRIWTICAVARLHSECGQWKAVAVSCTTAAALPGRACWTAHVATLLLLPSPTPLSLRFSHHFIPVWKCRISSISIRPTIVNSGNILISWLSPKSLWCGISSHVASYHLFRVCLTANTPHVIVSSSIISETNVILVLQAVIGMYTQKLCFFF